MDRNATKPQFLGDAFAHLLDTGEVTSVRVDDDFWSQGVSKLPPGRLLSMFENTADWDSWEMHPEADELILVMSGLVVLHFDDGDGRWSEPVGAGQFTKAPRGVWHTADVKTPGRLIFITDGRGTKHRQRSDFPT